MTDVERTGVLNHEALERLRRVGGARLLAGMIDLFLENAPKRIAAAHAAAIAGDSTGVARAMHSLKSTAGNLGAARLEELARRLEQAATAGDGAASAALLAQVEPTFAAARAALLDLREEPDP